MLVFRSILSEANNHNELTSLTFVGHCIIVKKKERKVESFRAILVKNLKTI